MSEPEPEPGPERVKGHGWGVSAWDGSVLQRPRSLRAARIGSVLETVPRAQQAAGNAVRANAARYDAEC